MKQALNILCLLLLLIGAASCTSERIEPDYRDKLTGSYEVSENYVTDSEQRTYLYTVQVERSDRGKNYLVLKNILNSGKQVEVLLTGDIFTAEPIELKNIRGQYSLTISVWGEISEDGFEFQFESPDGSVQGSATTAKN